MAGIPQDGLRYASIPSTFFDNDTRIDKLLDAQGWRGVGVYLYLLLRAYGSHGYYIEWCYADCATTARKMGGGISAGQVEEAIRCCTQVGLYDKRLLEEWGVLTNMDIQKNYLLALRKARRKVQIVSEYWLLAEEEAPNSLVSYVKNADECSINARECNKDDHKYGKDSPNMNMSMNDMKGREAPAAPAPSERPQRHKYGEYGWVLLTDAEYQRLLKDLGEAELQRCITYIDESAQSNGNKNRWKDWNLVIRKCSKNGWGQSGKDGQPKAYKSGFDNCQDYSKYF